MQAINDAKKKALEEVLKKAQEQAGGMAPGPMKLLFPCCGGPVNTLKKFKFVVPADKKDDFDKMVDNYDKTEAQVKAM
jgi:hypothetical protein